MQGNISSINYNKIVKHFPEKINNQRIETFSDNYNLNNIDLENVTNIYSSKSRNLILYNFENKVFLLDSKLNFIHEFFPSEIDDIKNFGYSSFIVEKNPNYNLIIAGFNKTNNIFLYFYKKKSNEYELINKVLIDSLPGNFYAKYVDNQIYILQQDNKKILIFRFDLNNEIVEKDDTLTFEIENDDISLSLSDNHIFIFSDIIYVISLKTNKVIEKLESKPVLIESYKIYNNYLTFIVESDKIIILDDDINTRQVIEISDINDLLIEDSYLVLFNQLKNKIYIFALDQNGLYVNFGNLTVVNKIKKIIFANQRLLIKTEEDGKIENFYANLPKRIFNREKFIGFGFYSEIDSSKGKYILLNNGHLSTYKKDDSLLIGYTSNLSDLVFDNSKLELKYETFKGEIPSDLDKSLIVISENLNFSEMKFDKSSSNFLFIENQIVEVYLKATKGSSLEIKNENKILTWDENGIIKLMMVTNSQVVEIVTKDNIEILGYKIRKYPNLFEYDIKILSDEGNVTINDKLLKNYQTFFPYIKSSDKPTIEGLINNKIEDYNIQFNLTPLKVNLPNYNSINEISINKLNQRFFRKYLIENNSKSILVTDLLSQKLILDYKIQSIDGIRKILFNEPILIILSKPKNDIDTHIHLVNSKDDKIIPYAISNNKDENLMEFLLFDSQTLVFVTKTTSSKQIYLVSFDSSYEVSDIKKITFLEEIKKLELFENLLVVESMSNEIIIYDIDICKAIVSLTDSNLISFNIIYNNLLVFMKENDIPKIHIYEIKPNFELIIEQEITQVNNSSYLNSFFGMGKVILHSETSIDIFEYDKFNGINYMSSINSHLVHYFENILVTKTNNSYIIYQFVPDLKYIDNHVNCNVKFEAMNIQNLTEMSKTTLFFQVFKKLHLSLNDTVIEKNLTKSTSIIQLSLNINANEEICIKNLGKNTNFCGIIVGEIKEKLPCFLKETLVKTPNGIEAIENLKEGDLIINENNEEVRILTTKQWTSYNFTEGTIPYVIPQNSLEKGYPNKDTFVSPFHRIKLPNGEFKHVNKINLPFIKKFQIYNGNLRYKDKIIEEITYFNFVLVNNSNFIANGMIVESLDSSNKNI